MTARQTATDVPSAGQQSSQSPSEPPLTLDEFCRELSLESPGVERIAGFHAHMSAQRRVRDYRAGYRTAFAAYRTRQIQE